MRKKVLPIILVMFLSSFIDAFGDGVKVVFRYDDYLLKPSTLSDSLLNLFRSKKIPICIGIVPFDPSGDFINKLDSVQISELRVRIAGGEVEVALHGFNHGNIIKQLPFSKPTYSEWAGVDYSEQLIKLSAGKKILDSLLETDIKVFVPPFNTYDDNTLRALEKLGFEVISGSRQGASSGKSIKYIPSTYEDFSSLIEIVEKNRDKDVSVIVYFHPYTFKGGSDMNSTRAEGDMTMEDLDSLLGLINSGKIESLTFSGLAKTGDYSGSSFRKNSMKYNLLKKVLNYTRHYSYGTLYNHSSSADILLKAGNIILHMIVFAAVFIFSVIFLKLLKPGIKFIIVFMVILLIPVSVYLIYIRNDFSFEMLVLMIFIILSALVSGIFKVYRSKSVVSAA